VEVVLHRRKTSGQILARLGPGDFFGEVSLLKGGRAIASVRAAAEGSVELLAQPREKFLQMIKESPLTEEALCKIVQQRLEENRAADRRKFPRN
jgi:CRP-like cAMP-binding protein